MKYSINQIAVNWVNRTNFAFAILGLIYLAVYAIEVTNPTGGELSVLLGVASWTIWGAFAFDLLVRFIASKTIGVFLKSSWLELLALILPFMRMLRVFRVILAIKGLKSLTQSRMSATGTYLLLLLPLAWFAGAIAVLDVESKIPAAPINNLPDAMWWSLSTIATVGYGDLYPVSLEGKFVAAILMITGIGLFSASAGIFASWIMGGAKK